MSEMGILAIQNNHAYLASLLFTGYLTCLALIWTITWLVFKAQLNLTTYSWRLNWTLKKPGVIMFIYSCTWKLGVCAYIYDMITSLSYFTWHSNSVQIWLFITYFWLSVIHWWFNELIDLIFPFFCSLHSLKKSGLWLWRSWEDASVWLTNSLPGSSLQGLRCSDRPVYDNYEWDSDK